MRDLYYSENTEDVYVKVQGGFRTVEDFIGLQSGEILTWTSLMPIAYRQTVTVEELRRGSIPLF